MFPVKDSRLEAGSELFGAGLYLIPSPLGNLGDISLRLIQIISQADLVAAEDTRRTIKLLNHLALKKKLISYREQNHKRAWPGIKNVLAAKGLVALLSDAGAPVVADPGVALVRAAREEGFSIIPVPGPSAVICALMASGFTGEGFTFAGFLPSGSKRKSFIQKLATLEQTLVFFETPYRLADSLKDLALILGARPALMAREMTKIHEEYLHMPLDRLAEEVRLRPRKGEITLVVEGAKAEDKAASFDLETFKEEILLDTRSTRVVTADWVAKTGLSKKTLYDLIVGFRKK